jgi:hypothetical protein
MHTQRSPDQAWSGLFSFGEAATEVRTKKRPQRVLRPYLDLAHPNAASLAAKPLGFDLLSVELAKLFEL